MSRISDLLQQIMDAVYGKDVRGAIHDSIEECYTNTSTGKTIAETAADSANTAASAANTAAANANAAKDAANAAASAANTAAANANAAKDAANAAASAANTAAANANAAKDAANAAAASAGDSLDYVATVENDSLASTAHAKGSYIIYDGTFYEVINPISVGDILTVGTNITAVPGGLGSEVTKLKSATDILSENALIITESDMAYYHDKSPSEITFYPNKYADLSVRYAAGKNLVEGMYRKGEQVGISRTFSADGRYCEPIGVSTGGFDILNSNNASALSALAGKTVNLYVYIHKQSGWANSSYFAINANDTRLSRVNFSPENGAMIGWTEFKNISFPSELTSIRAYFNTLAGSSFESGDYYCCVAYENEIINTGHILSDGTYTVDVSGLTNVDTVLNQSTIKTVEKTKEYVDNHVPDIATYWTDEIYALPEKFGAVGDGVTDDGQALTDCIGYAIQSGKAVRGFNKYKSSLPIVLSTQYMDVYVKELIYTGNSAAVEVQNQDIRFGFHRIVSDNIGIHFSHTSSTPVRHGRRSVITGNEINSAGDCIYAERATLYNTIDVRYVYSWNGNCITSSDDGDTSLFKAGEFVFRDCSFGCPNGYVSYNMQTMKMYNCTVEANCKYGYLNPRQSIMIGARHREQVDGQRLRIIEENTDYNNGALFVFTSDVNPDGVYGIKYISQDALPYFSIDTSAIQGYDAIQQGSGMVDVWNHLAYNGVEFGVPVRGVNNYARSVLGQQMFFIGNNKVYVPNATNIVHVDIAVCDLRLLEDSSDEGIRASVGVVKYMATDFIIDTDTTIYFNASFGAIGYNDITIAQHDGYVAVVYDKLGNILFNGANKGDGKWSLKCSMDRSSFGRYQGTTGWWCYDGTNEKWEVTKIS